MLAQLEMDLAKVPGKVERTRMIPCGAPRRLTVPTLGKQARVFAIMESII